MSKHLYAVAIKAFKQVPAGTMLQIKAIACLAVSQEEATGMGIEYAKQEEWPVEDGWHTHEAAATLIPNDVLEAALLEQRNGI